MFDLWEVLYIASKCLQSLQKITIYEKLMKDKANIIFEYVWS